MDALQYSVKIKVTINFRGESSTLAKKSEGRGCYSYNWPPHSQQWFSQT